MLQCHRNQLDNMLLQCLKSKIIWAKKGIRGIVDFWCTFPLFHWMQEVNPIKHPSLLIWLALSSDISCSDALSPIGFHKKSDFKTCIKMAYMKRFISKCYLDKIITWVPFIQLSRSLTFWKEEMEIFIFYVGHIYWFSLYLGQKFNQSWMSQLELMLSWILMKNQYL